MPYVKATEPHLLETYTPEVTQAYIRSRLESVAVVISDGKFRDTVGQFRDPTEQFLRIQRDNLGTKKTIQGS